MVRFDGEDINQLNDRQLSHLRLRFGFVFQNAALFDSMTIGQNVAFPLRQHGRFTDEQIREMVLVATFGSRTARFRRFQETG